MPKQDAEDVKKEVEEQKKEFYGDEAMGSGSPAPETDDDTGEMAEKVVGHKPERGDIVAHEVEEAEKSRRGVEPHEDEEEEAQ